MEIFIIKDGHIHARVRDVDSVDSVYELKIVSDSEIPTYPAEDAGVGKRWVLDYVNGVDGSLEWVTQDRPLTDKERLEELEAKLQATEILLGVDE